jgi:hypothetical protein
MLCPTGRQLSDDLSEAVSGLAQSDANMKNPEIAWEIRDERWRNATTLVAEARKMLSEHRSKCVACTGKG